MKTRRTFLGMIAGFFEVGATAKAASPALTPPGVERLFDLQAALPHGWKIYVEYSDEVWDYVWNNPGISNRLPEMVPILGLRCKGDVGPHCCELEPNLERDIAERNLEIDKYRQGLPSNISHE